jgi:TRAP-type C4-dicarboxylate transport system substrate-binding protein
MFRVKAILSVFLFSFSVCVAQAQSTTIRLATVAPDGSEWHDALLEMGDSLRRGTANRVTLRINAGGTQGSEEAVIDRMETGGPVDAALLTATGLALIDDAFNIFGLPFFFQSEAEMRYVRDRLTPMLAAKLEARGFRLLSWGEGGWVQLFSKQPLRTLPEVKRVKLYTSEGNDRMVQWYKTNGFNVVAMAESEILRQLKAVNGIDAVPIPPYPAHLLGIYRDAPYMLHVQVAELAGAAIVTARAWSRLSESDRKILLGGAEAMQKRIEKSVPQKDRESIVEMQKQGRDLKVTELDPKTAAEFRAEAEKLTAALSGNIVPQDVFEAALGHRAAFRAAGNGGR